MLRAWRAIATSPTPSLVVIGDGPERQELETEATGLSSVGFLGRQSRADTLAAMRGAQYLVFPSEWYEGLPMTIIEAFACGVPVIASRLGTMAEIVTEGKTGLLFNPGDTRDLAARMRWAHAHPDEMAAMGRTARQEYERRYTAASNLEQLLLIYERAIATATARRAARVATDDGAGTHPSVGEARG